MGFSSYDGLEGPNYLVKLAANSGTLFRGNDILANYDPSSKVLFVSAKPEQLEKLVNLQTKILPADIAIPDPYSGQELYFNDVEQVAGLTHREPLLDLKFDGKTVVATGKLPRGNIFDYVIRNPRIKLEF